MSNYFKRDFVRFSECEIEFVSNNTQLEQSSCCKFYNGRLGKLLQLSISTQRRINFSTTLILLIPIKLNVENVHHKELFECEILGVLLYSFKWQNFNVSCSNDLKMIVYF